MDPDSWPIIQLLFSLALSALFFLASGVNLEESTQKEISDSGIGVSLKCVASFIVCVPPLLWAASCVSRISNMLGVLVVSTLSNTESAHQPIWALTLCFFVFYIIIALAVAVVCVFLPLSWGRAHSEQYLSKLKPVMLFVGLFSPLARLVTMPARRILKSRGISEEFGSVTEEDVLDTVEELDRIDDSQKEMIGNIFELDNVKAADIMTHRTEIEAVPITASIDDITAIAIEYGYSRIPVYDGTLDHIIGVAYVKDLLPYVGKSSLGTDLSKLLRKTLFVPESCRARDLLIDFKQSKMQLAVVVDEYGGTAGIVSMEDILESIVGDIEDEYDEDEKLIVKSSDGSLICDGYADIDDVYDALGIEDIPDEIESDTIGGLLTDLLMRIPKSGEHPSAVYDGIELVALDADERRITGVSARLINKE
ncbi:MAG: hemolysin family protein [Oscillospiraceae bacterium]